MKIKLVARDEYSKDNGFLNPEEPLAPTYFYAISLVVYNDENVEIGANFIQTETLTEAFAGITEYGALKFNTLNSNLDTEIEFKAITVDTKEEVIATKTLTDLINMEVGGFLI